MRLRLLPHVLVTAAVAAALGAPGAALGNDGADASAPPGRITVDVITVNGSGCPAGTARVAVEPDNTGFRIAYDSFVARDGGTVNATEFRKNCQLSLVVNVPQGFTFAIAELDQRGRAQLENGATALQRTNYYFQGSADNNPVEHSFRGPLRGAWRTVDATAVAALVWAPCGERRGLNVNTELRVDAGDAHPGRVSSISLRSTEADVDTLFHFSWRECR